MSQTEPLLPTGGALPSAGLHAELRALIAGSPQRLAGAVNAELTRLYWTELPPKAELEQRLHQALVEARETMARRGVLLEGEGDGDE